MSKDINDIIKEVQKTNQELYKTNKEVHNIDSKLSKDVVEIKKILKSLNRKMDLMIDKIQEFEIIMDAAEIIEDHQADEEDKYNTEWNPYDEDHDGEDYEDHENDNE
jgi:DNA anti-recombination protein RmuC